MKMIAFLKKFFVMIASIVLTVGFVFSVKISTNEGFDGVFQLFSAYKEVVIVTKENPQVENFNKLQNGNQFYIKCNKTNCLKVVDQIEKIDGVVLHFSKETPLKYFQSLLNYDLSIQRNIEKSQVYYGYTSSFDGYVICNQKRVNVQLAKTSNGWVLGVPMILTGF